MSNIKEMNGRLSDKPYLSSFSPSQDDAKAFEEMFGSNANVIQWVARMASYYQGEREEILNGSDPKQPKKAAAPAAPAKAAPAAAADDDDIDLFGEETEEDKAALEAKKAKDAEKKKAAKPAVVARSSILIDIKGWDDTIDLEALAAKLKAIERPGLLWGAHKLAPVAFGVMKLQQLVIVEDDKVSSDDLEDIITGFEDEVQSMDIVAFNKV